MVNCVGQNAKGTRQGGSNTMGRRCHIIYAHPAQSDGYTFFYLYYYPGERQLSLRYSQDSDDVKEVSLPPVAMLDLIENRADLRLSDDQLRPWDRAAKALRIRLRIWMNDAQVEDR